MYPLEDAALIVMHVVYGDYKKEKKMKVCIHVRRQKCAFGRLCRAIVYLLDLFNINTNTCFVMYLRVINAE